ncbi:unnamed protein product [Nippostrongylus brasiliensis]|uniref:8.9 kDa family member n=1 Tax=Nippostrongylus brasiliensis TaxID=27835 RepID=A0A0N4Y0D1_NIPBR|nr:hypothetical protein Q1695_012985 [Nippostrongylus brasiliensis]VDL72566.1 unnamed protein product [Nippostrongylus brasiliensis]
MQRVVVLFALVALICAQNNRLPCGFTCTRTAEFRVSIDGRMTTATCTANNANPAERCPGCCQARALAAGLTANRAGGFPSNNGVDCVCCINNPC